MSYPDELQDKIYKQKRAIANRDKTIVKLEESLKNYKTTACRLNTQRNEAYKELLQLRIEVAELKGNTPDPDTATIEGASDE